MRLHWFTGGSRELQGITGVRKGSMRLQGVTGQLQGVTRGYRGYKGLRGLQEVTGGYITIQEVTVGY